MIYATLAIWVFETHGVLINGNKIEAIEESIERFSTYLSVKKSPTSATFHKRNTHPKTLIPIF